MASLMCNYQPPEINFMEFKTLIPNIFYADLSDGLKLFVDCLGFTIIYQKMNGQESPFCVVEKDYLKIHLVENKEQAEKARPELRLETNNIKEVYQRVKASHPELLHPNLNKITTKPWKAKEFALLDESGVCIVIQEW